MSVRCVPTVTLLIVLYTTFVINNNNTQQSPFKAHMTLWPPFCLCRTNVDKYSFSTCICAIFDVLTHLQSVSTYRQSSFRYVYVGTAYRYIV